MNVMLTPEKSLVDPGLLLNLIVRKQHGVEAKPFVVSKQFNISTYLSLIRSEGYYKSEDVLLKLAEALERDGIIVPVESYTLDVGEQGRPSEALEEHYRYSLNTSAWTGRSMVASLEQLYMQFMGEQGDLHLLKTEEGRVLAHAMILIDIFDGDQYQCELDIVGPDESTLPKDLSSQIEVELIDWLKNNHPDTAFDLKVMLRRSDLLVAMESLHEQPHQPYIETWAFGNKRYRGHPDTH
jgi:hypothetical protein